VRITNAFYRVIYRAVNNHEYNSEVQSLRGQEKEQEKLNVQKRGLKIKRARQKQRVCKYR